jgi:hypothetical protein
MVNFVTHPLPGEKQARLLRWVVGILGILFFLNCFTPLRLHYDMLRYFSIKDCIESKCPPGADPKDYLPLGYTALLLLLSKLGILKSFSIVFVNCLYLAGGLYFVRKIFRNIQSPFFLFILVLLNWTIIKFVLHPLSELQYMFFSFASLYAYCQFILNKKIRNLILALLLAGVAFLTRTVGIVLVAALFSALAWEYRKQLAELIRKNRILLLLFAFLVILVIIFSRQLGLNHYLSAIPRQFQGGLRFSNVLIWHFSEWGELLINAPRVKAGSVLPVPYGDWIFFIIGLMGICVFIYICFFKKNSVPFVIKAYLFFYILLMFNWPFPDPRFWVPVVPLIAAVVSQFSISRNRFIRFFTTSYFLFYLIIGITALGYMTYTSFNKRELAKTQAKGVFRNEYEMHFFGKTLSDTVTQVDPNLVNFLNKYDK